MTVDFHAHMHPGADHGCKGSAVAGQQLALARNAGMGAVVTVSHYYPLQDSTRSYLERRALSAEKLGAITAADGSLPRVFVGSEVTLCHGLEKMEDLHRLCISGTDCMLIEMPFCKWDARLIDALEAIKYDLHITPVLAHVDRYDVQDADALLSHGYAAQLNYEGFASLFGKKPLIKWAEKGCIHALGSDIHGTDVGYKNLDKAKKALGGGLFEDIMEKSCRLLGIREGI